MITLDRLRYFIAVAKLEHVGKAAIALHTSPSVISSAIKELESTIGCALFIREKKRVKLGLEGKELLGRAQKILNEVDSIQKNLGKSTSKLEGHFKLGASHFLMHEFLIHGVLEIKKGHPNVTLELASLDSGVAVSRVLGETLDAALVFRSSYHDNLQEIILYEDSFGVFVRKGHPALKASPKLAGQQLNSLPAITFRSLSGANFWESHPAFNDLGINPAHAFFYDDTAACIQLLEKTDGWAFIPTIVGEQYQNISRVRFPIEKKAPVNISMVFGRGERTLLFIQRLNKIITARLTSIRKKKGHVGLYFAGRERVA